MANELTSDKLIKSIKRRAMIPNDQDTFEDQDFLDMINEEIQYFGVQHLLSTYEEYLVTKLDFPLDADDLDYNIPSRAIGNKLRGLFYVNSSDNLFELSRISLEDLPSYNNYNSNFTNGVSSTFYVEDNKIVLVDELPFTDGSLRMYFYLKPNVLVENDRAAVISSINRTTGEIILSNVPDGFSNLPIMDFVQTKSPNKILDFDKTPTSIDTNTKTIIFSTSDIPESLEAGDYINFASESIVPQLPTELHGVLAQRVAVAALEAMNDTEGLNNAKARLEQMEKSTLSILDNRVESANEKIRAGSSTLQETNSGGSGRGLRGKY